jgi:hypothetical protein
MMLDNNSLSRDWLVRFCRTNNQTSCRRHNLLDHECQKIQQHIPTSHKQR